MEDQNKLYLQLLALSTGPAVRAVKSYFEAKVLNTVSFEDFLNDTNNKHKLFHQFIPQIPCCECLNLSIAAPGKSGCLIKQQYHLLYDDSGKTVQGHEITKGSKISQLCLCKVKAKTGINVKPLDITLLYIIISHCCHSLVINPNWIPSLKKIRNRLCHDGTGKVEKIEYDTLWKELKSTTLDITEQIGSTVKEVFEDLISNITDVSIEKLKNDIKKSNDDIICKLEHVLNGMKPMQTHLEEVKKSVEEVKQEQQNLKHNIETKLGRFTEKNSNLKVEVEISDASNRIQNDKVKIDVKRGETIKIEIQLHADGLDENKVMATLPEQHNDNPKEELQLESIEKKCILLKMCSDPHIFRSKELLHRAIMSLIRKVVAASEIDIRHENTLNVSIAFTSPLTNEQREVVCSMISTHGLLYEQEFSKLQQSEIAVKTDYNTVQDATHSTEILSEIDNIKFRLRIKGFPQVEESGHIVHVDEGEAPWNVAWNWSFSRNYDVEEIVSVLKDNQSSFKSHWFEIDVVESNIFDQLILHTTTQMHAFTTLYSFETAVNTFINKLSELCAFKPEPQGEKKEVEIRIVIRPSIMKDREIPPGKSSDNYESNDETTGEPPEKRTKTDNFDKEEDMEEMLLEKSDADIIIVSDDENTGEPPEKRTKTDNVDEKEELKGQRKSEKTDIVLHHSTLSKLEAGVSVIDESVRKANSIYNKLSERTYHVKKLLNDPRRQLSIEEVAQYYKVKNFLDQANEQKLIRLRLIKDFKHIYSNKELIKPDAVSDLSFLDEDYQSVDVKCNMCGTENKQDLTSFCDTCKDILCTTCLLQHKRRNNNHKYKYEIDICCGFKKSREWTFHRYIIDIKYLTCQHVVAIGGGQFDKPKINIYNLNGNLISTMDSMTAISKTQIAVVNPNIVAISSNNSQHLEIANLQNKTNDTKSINGTMTGAIVYLNGKLYVACKDMVDVLDLNGEWLGCISIPKVEWLYSTGNEEIHCIHKEDSGELKMSRINATSYSLISSDDFLLQPDAMAIDEVGNILFIHDGVVWRANKDFTEFKIVISSASGSSFRRLCFDQQTKALIVAEDYSKIWVYDSCYD